jgi:hypothetical protein
MTATERAKRHSDDKLESLRAALHPAVPEGNIVLTCGSYARREASGESDIDFFIVTNRLPESPEDPAAAWINHTERSHSDNRPGGAC